MINKPEISKSRTPWIDIAKGIGILLVIYGHSSAGFLHNVIYDFHMALFFMLSGFVYKDEEKFGKFLWKKIKSLVIPYLLFSPLVFISNYIYGNHLSIPAFLLSVVIEYRNMQSLWFLYVLFFINIFFYFLRKIRKSQVQWILIICLAFIGCTFINDYGIRIPFDVDLTIICIPFFAFGYVIKEKSRDGVKLDWRQWILFSSFAILSGVISYCVTGECIVIAKNEGIIFPLYYICGISASLLVFDLSRRIGECQALQYIGKNSLFIYAFSCPFALVIIKRILQFDDVWYRTPIYFVLQLALTLAVNIGIRSMRKIICNRNVTYSE